MEEEESYFVIFAAIVMTAMLMKCCYTMGRKDVLLRLHNAPAHEVHILIEDMREPSSGHPRRYKSVTSAMIMKGRKGQ